MSLIMRHNKTGADVGSTTVHTTEKSFVMNFVNESQLNVTVLVDRTESEQSVSSAALHAASSRKLPQHSQCPTDV